MEPGRTLSFPRRLFEALLACGLVSVPYGAIGQIVPPTDAPLVTPLDAVIPFVPATIWIYLPGYWLLFLLTAAAVRGAHAFRAGLAGIVTLTALAVPFFVLWPVAGPRPSHVAGDGLTAAVVRMLWENDPIGNTFPSLHVANATFCAFLAWQGNRRLGAVAAVLAVLVAVSTVTMKQHWVADIPAGMVLGAAGALLWRTWMTVVPKPIPAPAWLERFRIR